MGYLSPSELATLHAFFQTAPWSAYDDQTRFEKLHQPTLVANPINLAPQVPVPYYASLVLSKLSPASLAGIHTLGYLDAVRTDIDNNDSSAVGVWLALFLGSGAITQAEHDEIQALLTATQADPSWSSQIPAGPSARQTLFPNTPYWEQDAAPPLTGKMRVDFITLDDVKAAR